MTTTAVLVEMIGGPRAVVEIDLSLAAVKVAATVAKTLGRTIHDDDGNEKPWKIYAPNRSGGFAPIPVSATLEAAARAIQKKIDSGADAGFAGPGEHEGSAYSFRIRLFVPSPPPPIHVIETPTVSDDEVIDLTNLDGDDDLESVRRNPERSVTRKRRVRGDGPRDDGKGEKTRKGKKGIGKRKRKRRKPAADKEAVVADDQPSSEEPVPEQPAEEQPAEDEPAEEDATSAEVAAARASDTGGRHESQALSEEADAVSTERVESLDDDELAPTERAHAPSEEAGEEDEGAPHQEEGDPEQESGSEADRVATTRRVPAIPPPDLEAESPGEVAITRSFPVSLPEESAEVPLDGRTTGGGRGGRKRRAKKSSKAPIIGLAVSLTVVGVVILGLLHVLKEPPHSGKAGTQAIETLPNRAAPARSSDSVQIEPLPGASVEPNDPVAASITRFNSLGAESPADLATPENLAVLDEASAALAEPCETGGRWDACLARSRLLLARHRACHAAECGKTGTLSQAVRCMQLGLSQVKAIEDPKIRRDAGNEVVYQAVRIGGTDWPLLDAEAPKLAGHARRLCSKPIYKDQPDCSEASPAATPAATP